MARAPPTSSHTYSARPTTPSSAATVSGVKCETKFGVGFSLPDRRRLAWACPPVPTPNSGASSTTFTVSVMRVDRSLVSRRRESPRISIEARNPSPSTSTSATPPTTTRRTGGPPVTKATNSVTHTSATMLDCE